MFQYVEDKAWEILLLDIEMGTVDEFSLAKKIQQNNEALQIVSITALRIIFPKDMRCPPALLNEAGKAEQVVWRFGSCRRCYAEE